MKRRFSEGFLLKSCFGVFSKEKIAENNAKIDAAKKHLNKYLNELKLHFDLSDIDIIKLLVQMQTAKKPENPFLKYLSVLRYWN